MNILIFVVGFFLFLHLLAFICCYDYHVVGIRLNKKRERYSKTGESNKEILDRIEKARKEKNILTHITYKEK